ncbi:OLC1v1009605C1 [Oldenlandia corymbosa var. corymbosa]|uniref:OLC1v1009605C1 n=1 Tax=Oldenlandia corymbosa var. corymbosa TaxID=529605 RepID=A0AAV1DPW0_OLDCO|nr:OLC1v1009605C1 [Oldenlandia corymbosa var. corymbosa]
MRIIIFSHGMHQAFFGLNLNWYHIHIKPQFHSIFTQASLLLSGGPCLTSLAANNQSHGDSPLPQPRENFRGIAKSVIAKCSHLRVNDGNRGESLVGLSLKDYFLRLSNLSPDTVRRFWRVSVLRPQDVLDILLGFEFHSAKSGVELEEVKSLWGVFQWASEQHRDFQHLPLSCKTMAKMLVRVGMFGQAECLLSRLDGEGVLLDCHEIFSDLIEGYVAECDFGRAVMSYDRMKTLGLLPSFSCYRSLIDLLVQMNEVQFAYGAFLDMIKVGMGRTAAEHGMFDNVERLLCMDGKIQEARELAIKGYVYGVKPNNLVLDAIVNGYCQKMDYDDILSFLVEIRGVPDVAIGNKAIRSLCRNFGSQRAYVFMQELEQLGFCPNNITFGILIAQTSSEGMLRDGFILLSEMLSRNLKPDVNTCNALMSALFKEDMWKQPFDILLEMKDWGVTPEISTFKVLLAGALKAKQIGKVRAVVGLMEDHGLTPVLSPENHLSTALAFLGLNPLVVKIRRDNDSQFSKTQFYDDLGNGLYLETDVDKLEKSLTRVLDDAMFPEFNSLVFKNCQKGDPMVALQMVDEMAQWGQVLSVSAASALVNKLSTSQMNIKMLNSLLENIPYPVYQLHIGALNKLIQKFGKRGFTYKAKIIFNKMLQMKLEIDSDTYSSILISSYKKDDLKSFHQCWQLARDGNWLPQRKDGRALLDCLCQSKLLEEALELLEIIILDCRYHPMDTFPDFFQKLCSRGLTSIADVLAKEVQKLGLVLDDESYNHLMSGFCKEKKLGEAFVLLDALFAKKFDPSLISAPLLIRQLCLSGYFDKAILLKERCLEKHPSGLVLIYQALIDGLCTMGMVGEAFIFFQDIMQRKLADNDMHNMLILGYSQDSDPTRLRGLLGVMIRNNITISISSYRSLVQREYAAGKFSMALSLKKLMVGDCGPPSITLYHILMFYVCQLQESGLLKKLVKEIQDSGLQLDGISYNLIIEGFANSKDVSHSLWYLNAMISKGFKPNNRCLRKVMGVLLSFGKAEKVLELNQEMESRGWVHGSVVQINIVEALMMSGRLSEALKFLDRITSKGLIPDKVDYNFITKQLCQHGELSKAADLLNIMTRKGSILDSTSFDYLIHGLCRIRKLDTALDYHSEMLCRNLTPNNTTWTMLVRELCEIGRVAEAEELLQLMGERGEVPSKEMYSAVLNRYRSENNLRKASQVLKAMQESGYEPDFETHWSLIRNFSHPNNNKDERGFLSRLLSGTGFGKKH